MIKIKKYSLFVMTITAILFGLFAGLNVIGVFASNHKEFALSMPISEYLKKGDVLIVPDGAFGDLTADTFVYAPDGQVYVDKNVELSVSGDYFIRYTAEENGKAYLHDEKFTVENPSVQFSGNASSAEYVYNDAKAKRDGLLVSIAPNETFYYNGIIDFNEYSDMNPPVKFTLSPNEKGVYDAIVMKVTFTDVYDGNNKVEWRISCTDGDTTNPSIWQPSLVRANNQAWKGWCYSGAQPRLWVNNYGTYIEIYNDDTYDYGNGKFAEDVLAKQEVGCWLDVETNSFWTYTYSHASKQRGSAFAIDLDDNSYQETLFDGFTTGEVYMSVTCERYNQPTANLLFTKIGSHDLKQETVKDDKAPEIKVDEGALSPIASVGYAYPVEKAVGLDNMCGYVDVKTRVFFGYDRAEGIYKTKGGAYQKEISVVNGKFNTKEAGEYSIVYSAVDYSGNYTEKVVKVTAVDMPEDINSVTLNSDYAMQAQAGNVIELATVESYVDNFALNGGIARITIDYEVFKKNGEKREEQTVSGNGIVGYSFVPSSVGEYEVVISLSNYVGYTVEEKYIVTVEEQNGLAFVKKPDLPKYLVSGVEYVIPDLEGVTKDGKKEFAQITVHDGNGAKDYQSGSKIQFTADANGMATIAYAFSSGIKSYEIPVIETREGKTVQAEKYFISTTASASAQEKYVQIDFAEDGTVEYANELLADGFTTTFSVVNFGAGFTSLGVCLTDGYSEDKKATLEFRFNGKGVDAYVDGELRVKNVIADVADAMDLTVGYNPETLSFTIGSSISLSITNTDYGYGFDGFNSKKVYLAFAYEGVTAQSSIFVKKIFNQDMGSISQSDNRNPAISIMGDYGLLLRGKGKYIDVYSAVACDVLSPYTSITVSVEYNYMPIEAVDGQLLSSVDCSNGKEYKVKLDAYGEYMITYTARDWNKKVASTSIIITVADIVAPTLNIEGEVASTAKIGTVNLPQITVTDDNTQNPVLYVVVFAPNGEVIYVKDGVFTANVSGEYELRITAMDDFGNSVTKKYVIIVG